MDLGTAIFGIVTLVLGAGLTFLTSWFTNRRADERADAREKRADEKQRHAAGREHARAALDIVRVARHESWTRAHDPRSYDLDLDDLQLDVAEARIDLIPDPVLRPRLASVLSTVRYPTTLSNSSYVQDGYPIETQRRGLWLLQQALAAYVREEATPAEPDALAKLAKLVDDAHAEREEWEEDRAETEKAQRAKKSKGRKKPTA